MPKRHYVVAGSGPAEHCMHGWLQNGFNFLAVRERFASKYSILGLDILGCSTSDQPFDGYEPKTVAGSTAALAESEGSKSFHRGNP